MRSNTYYGDQWNEWDSWVTINGDVVENLGWESEHGWMPLPGSVVDKDNFPTATIYPIVGDAETDRPPNLWLPDREFPPKLNDRITIEARPVGANPTWPPVRLFTGKVDSVDGDTLGELQIDCISLVDDFGAAVDIEPLIEYMPKKWEYQRGLGSPDELVLSQLHNSYHVNACFEASGYHAMMPQVWSTFIRVPNIGSRHPLGGIGDLVHCRQLSGAGGGSAGDPDWTGLGNPNSNTIPTQATQGWFGVGALGGDFIAHYRPWLGWVTDPSLLYIRIQKMGDVSTGDLVYYLDHDDVTGHWTALRHNAGGSITLYLRKPGYADRWSTIPASQVGDFVIVECRGGPQGPKLKTSVNGVVTEAQITPVGGESFSGACNRVAVACDSTRRAGGFCLSDAVDTPPPLEWTPTAYIEYDNSWESPRSVTTPSVIGRPAKDVLDEIAEAELRHWGIHPDGRAIYASTIKRYFDITDIDATFEEGQILDKASWKLDSRATASDINYKFRLSTTTKTWGRRKAPLVGNGRGEVVPAGGMLKEAIDVPNDEEWIFLDFTPWNNLPANPVPWGSETGMSDSLFAGTKEDDVGGDPDGEIVVAGDAGNPDYGVHDAAQLTYRSWTITHHAPNVGVTLRTNKDSRLNPALRDQNTPILRAKARVINRDADVQASTLPGPMVPAMEPGGAVIEVDAGAWVPSRGQVEVFAAVLGLALGREQYLLSELETMPDLRVQIGDTVKLGMADSMGVEITGFCRGLKYQFDPENGLRQWTDIAVTKSEVVNETYYMLEDHWNRIPPVNNYAALEQMHGFSYEHFESDPI